VDPVVALLALGGAARAGQLRRAVPRRRLAAAVADGRVSREGKAYRLVRTDDALVAARALHGVRSHRSAAQHHGFALPPGPETHDVLVPPGSKRARVSSSVRLHWGPITEAEQVAGVTSPLRTVVLCLRDLPLRDALSVGDSALRCGAVQHAALGAAVVALRGPGSAVARQRFDHLDARAENAFESCMRAILLEAGITGFEPQVSIRHRTGWIGRVDLADRARRIVIECDGFEFHSDRAAFTKDARRFTLLVAAGWRPLRVTWPQVMYDPEWALARVQDVLDLAGASTEAERRDPASARAA
jgi:very-short-patch-repair endonuclease